MIFAAMRPRRIGSLSTAKAPGQSSAAHINSGAMRPVASARSGVGCHGAATMGNMFGFSMPDGSFSQSENIREPSPGGRAGPQTKQCGRT